MSERAEAESRRERELARRLIDGLSADAQRAMRFRGMDLRSSAEHLLYTALRLPVAERRSAGLGRSLGRIARATVRARASRRSAPGSGRPRVAVFVTRSVHLTLFRPIGRLLDERGIESVVVDAETRDAHQRAIEGTSLQLTRSLRRGDALDLAFEAVALHSGLRNPPAAWRTDLADAEAKRLLDALRLGVPIATLDLARVDALLERLRPAVTACFSESGLLARIVPTASRSRGIAAVDLPHAEAADPWGTVGVEYDALAVYGPRSRRTLEAAGVAADRILEIGPLRYDELISSAATPPLVDPRRVIFASQPSDARKPATHPDVKRAAMSAALAATRALAPAELVVVPHPTEPPGEAESFLSQVAVRDGTPARVVGAGDLHDLLRGAWLLVTASSQSIFDAILCGVPSITVNPTGDPDPVSFATDGIASGAHDDTDASAAAAGLATGAARADAVARAREALGGRIGPLDGHAAERAAEWLAGLATRDAPERHGRSRR